MFNFPLIYLAICRIPSLSSPHAGQVQDILLEVCSQAPDNFRKDVDPSGFRGHHVPAVHCQRGREQVVSRVLLPSRTVKLILESVLCVNCL